MGATKEYIELEKQGLKRCTVCGEIKKHSEFYRRKPTGKCASNCKLCLEKDRRAKGMRPASEGKIYNTKEEKNRVKSGRKRRRKYQFTEEQWVRGGSCVCKQCNKKFVPIGKEYSTYCSRECWFQYQSEHRMTKTCTVCGKEFYAMERKGSQCSNECYLRTITKTCLYCDKKFHPRDVVTEGYCSKECKYQQGLKWNRERKASKIVWYTKECVWCGKEYVTWREDRRYCSFQCGRNARGKRRRARKYKVKAEKIDYWVVYQRDGGVCYLCGELVHKKYGRGDVLSGTLDHVVALCNGGSHTYDNIRLAHLLCNSYKGSTSFIPLERDYYVGKINNIGEEKVIPC